jgi:glutaconate CoA-transferase subunit B
MLASCLGVFAMLQQGSFDLGLLSAAQVDRHGNLNSTALGSYEKPKVRLVGSGGAHDIAVLARAAVILMPHDPRRFVQEVDFATSPGLYGSTGNGTGAARDSGPRCVITPRARFTFEAGELTLDALVDGMDESAAFEGFGWSVPHAARLDQLPPLTDLEIAVASDVLESWGRDAV